MSDREHFRKSYLIPLLDAEQLLQTIPEKPNSSKQKYYSSDKNIDPTGLITSASEIPHGISEDEFINWLPDSMEGDTFEEILYGYLEQKYFPYLKSGSRKNLSYEERAVFFLKAEQLEARYCSNQDPRKQLRHLERFRDGIVGGTHHSENFFGTETKRVLLKLLEEKILSLKSEVALNIYYDQSSELIPFNGDSRLLDKMIEAWKSSRLVVGGNTNIKSHFCSYEDGQAFVSGQPNDFIRWGATDTELFVMLILLRDGYSAEDYWEMPSLLPKNIDIVSLSTKHFLNKDGHPFTAPRNHILSYKTRAPSSSEHD